MLNQKRISFIVCTNNEQYMQECRYYIDRLYIPDGMSVDVLELKNMHSITEAYNIGMKKTDAKYKIYLHQDVFLIKRTMLFELMECFKDNSLGMIGTIGGTLRRDADIHHYWDRGNTLNATYYQELEFNHTFDTDDKYIEVEGIDGMFMATQYDVSWDESIVGWHMYDISQSIRFRENGYKVGVINYDESWTLHDACYCSEREYDRARQLICKLYPKYFVYSSIERDLYLEEDATFQQEILDEIKNREIDKQGYASVPQDISLDDFYSFYCQVKFLLKRIEYGMPKEDWSVLVDYIVAHDISSSFLMVALNRCVIFVDRVAEIINRALKKPDEKLVLFDQYQRYHTVAQEIRGFKQSLGVSRFNILEVGANVNQNLGIELPGDDIYYSDLYKTDFFKYDNKVLIADATNMENFSEDSFDICVALDVFEHICEDKRVNFIKELLRVSKNGVILCFPYKASHVEMAEKEVNDLYKEKFGHDNMWLIEHIENGLPDTLELERLLDEMGVSYFSYEHGDVSVWKKMTYINSFWDYGECVDALSLINVQYNAQEYEHDVSDAMYRKFYVIYKADLELNRLVKFYDQGVSDRFKDELEKIYKGTV